MEKDSKKIICKDVHGKEYEIAVGNYERKRFF